jgi:hypothetical protein
MVPGKGGLRAIPNLALRNLLFKLEENTARHVFARKREAPCFQHFPANARSG